MDLIKEKIQIKNLLQSKKIFIIYLVIFIIFYSVSFVAAAGISNFVVKDDILVNKVAVAPSATNTPTVTLTPAPTVVPVSSSPTPTTSTTGRIILKYLKVNTQDLLERVDTEVKVTGPTSTVSKGTKSLHTIENLLPGKYQVIGGTPAGYFLSTLSCNSSCRSFDGSQNWCDQEFDLKAGQTVEIYCGYLGSGVGAKDNSGSNQPGKPEFTISYPTEGQTITFTSPSQTLCVVTIPVANVEGAIISYNLNSQGWQTGYCFLPPEGSNSVQMKIKNSGNVESDPKSVNFTFVKNY